MVNQVQLCVIIRDLDHTNRDSKQEKQVLRLSRYELLLQAVEHLLVRTSVAYPFTRSVRSGCTIQSPLVRNLNIFLQKAY